MSNILDGIIKDANEVTKEVDLKELNNKSILLTGASGLMGVHFLATIRVLVEQMDYKITIYSLIKSAPLDYFKELSNFQGSIIMRGDITDYQYLRSLPNVDFIIHSAGYGQPGKFLDDQVKTLKLNTFSTFELFDKLNIGGKFLFISTSEIYSGLTNAPFNEHQIGITNTDHPRACYIEAKRCGEAIVNSYRSRGIEAKSARLSLAYGPGTQKNDKRVLNSFIEKALKGDIHMMDEGLALRTYCYVSDAISIMWNILLHGESSTYNVGGNSQTTIKELAEIIARDLNVKVSLPKEVNTLPGSPDNVYLDMTKVKKEFKKITFKPLAEGIKNTIEWQKILYSTN